MTGDIHAVIGLTGWESSVGGVKVARENFARLQLPGGFTREHVDTIQQDLSIMSELVGQYPGEFLELQNAVVNQDFAVAREIAHTIGLSEEAFAARRGGIVLLIIAIAVASALLLSSDSPPPPPPPPPTSDGGAPDAGTG
jgi:hypothetical protein